MPATGKAVPDDDPPEYLPDDYGNSPRLAYKLSQRDLDIHAGGGVYDPFRWRYGD